MVELSLDDTLHAIVQLTHEHGLPLAGAHARAGRVQVDVDPADLRWWVRWLADPAVDGARFTVWIKNTGEVVLYVYGCREGIEWTVVDLAPRAVADAVLATHGVTATCAHLRVSAAAACALADSLAADAAAVEATGGEPA